MMKKILSLDINQIFYYSALVFGFILSLSRAGISFFLLWFLILFLLQNNLKQRWDDIKTNPTLQAMSLFLGFIVISIFWSTNLNEAINQIRLYGYWILIPILAVSLKKEWLSNIITAFLLGMFVNEILMYGVFFDFWQIKGHTHTDPCPFMNHIQYSIFLGVTAIILLNRLLSNRYTLRDKSAILVFFLTTTTNLFISGGRTGQVAFLVSITLVVIIHYRASIKSFILFLLISSILFISAYSLLPIFEGRVQQTVSDIQQQQEGIYNTSVGLRNGFWMIAYDAFKLNPLFGSGLGDYKDSTKEALANNKYNFEDAAINFFKTSDYHNQHLMILIQLGLVGFSLMVWFIIKLYQIDIEDPELKEVSILSLTIFFISALAESLWIAQFPIILFIFIVSISLAAAKPSHSLRIEEKGAL
ncbi:MAG: O-antigen ligase family protein [Sulfuricurvum sp.]|nr:O-antigen ligase family protein [Sulfuricurvum sp.]